MANLHRPRPIPWKLVSSNVKKDFISYEYEAPVLNSDRKYQMSVVVNKDETTSYYSVT